MKFTKPIRVHTKECRDQDGLNFCICDECPRCEVELQPKADGMVCEGCGYAVPFKGDR